MTTTAKNKNSADTSAEIYDSFKIMHCRCPVCKENTELDLSQISSASHEADCTACNSPITIKRISYSQREKKSTSFANCASCGNPLTDLQRCDSCGAVFPDFYEAVKSARKKVSPAAESKPRFSPVSVALVIILIFATAGLSFYNYMQSREQYIDTYFRMLNAVITGIDTNIRISSLKGNAKISAQDEATVNRIKTATSRLENELSRHPVGLAAPKEKLNSLMLVYNESNTLITYPPGTQKELSELQTSIKKKRDAAANDIKTSLPTSFVKGLENARLKYRGLKEF